MSCAELSRRWATATPSFTDSDDVPFGDSNVIVPDIGSQVHEFAEDYALRKDVTPDSDDEEYVKAFLDSLSGELRVEERAYLPLEVDGERITLSGIIDLVHVTDNTIEIVDFKTDLSQHAESKYRIQLSEFLTCPHRLFRRAVLTLWMEPT